MTNQATTLLMPGMTAAGKLQPIPLRETQEQPRLYQSTKFDTLTRQRLPPPTAGSRPLPVRNLIVFEKLAPDVLSRQ